MTGKRAWTAVTEPLRILFVEDDPHDAELEERELRQEGLNFVSRRVDRRPELELVLEDWNPQLVLSDFSMPGLAGLDVLATVRRRLPDVPFIFVSGTIGEERAIEAMRQGATDYVVKDRLAGLAVRVRRALDEAAQRDHRRHLEAELRQSQKLDALGRLAGAVAHDFNNLLTAILSCGELALNRLAADHPARPDVEQIHRAGESAVALTRQLLAFSRKSDFVLKAVDLNAVVAATTRLLSRLVDPSIEVALRLDPASPAVRADVGGLEQILLNLALNARDAMPAGGRLLLETSRGAASTRAGQDWVLLRVTDTGQGIDPPALPRIFEPFFTTKPAGMGTGLGLSTVYGLVQTFGGSISVTSEVGRGTTFWITLPAAAAAESGAGVVKPKLPTGKETVLVAEDAPVIRSLVVQVLSAQGYTVLDAADGPSALALAEGHRGDIHLLLTDLVMPGFAGSELAERLCALRPSLKVILMTGRADAELPSTAHLLLSKPFTPLRLSESVRSVLDRPD